MTLRRLSPRGATPVFPGSGVMISQSENGASLNQGLLDPSTTTLQVMASYSIMHGEPQRCTDEN